MDSVKDEKRRLASNTIFSSIAWLFPIVIGFITTPILVKGLGAEQYGILAIILGFLSYSFTFGTGKVVAKFIPEYRAAGEEHKLAKVVSATFLFSLLIGLAGSITVAVLTNYIVSDILLIPVESQTTTSRAFYFACATGLAMMMGQTFQYVLQGVHRFGSYVLLTNLNGVLLAAGNILLVINGYGVAAIMCWNFVVATIIGFLFYMQSRRALQPTAIDFKVDKSMFMEVARYGGNIILFQIFANVLYIFERTWVVRKFGPEGLMFYVVPMLLALYLHGFIASFVQAIFPKLNELLNDHRKLTLLYQKSTKIVLAIVVFIGVVFISSGKLFLSLWIDADLAVNSYNLLVIHTVTFALVALLVLPLQLAEANRFSSLTAIVTGSWMLIAVPLMIITADPWKSEGVALSRLASVVLTFPLIFFVEKRFLGSFFWKFWVSISFRVLFAALAMAAVGYQISSRFSPNWVTLAAAVAAGGLVYVAILLFTGYVSKEEKTTIRDLIFGGHRLA